MRKYIIAFTTLILIGVLFSSLMHAEDATVQTDQDLSKLAIQDIKLKDIKDMKSTEMYIDKAEAIASASSALPEWASNAKSTHVELHLVSNSSFQMFSDAAKEKNKTLKEKGIMDNIPAYIVSFKGLHVVSQVPANFKGEAPIHTEYSVIIDAVSGEALMGYSYQ